MAAALVEAIDILTVTKMCPAYRSGQRVLGAWNGYNVHMIAHQAIPRNLQAVVVRLFFQ
jgi:hypothetical protein